MIIPVRCFSCNKVIADKWDLYQDMKKKNIDNYIIFKTLNIRRYCCKRMLITHIELIDKL
jgi:DNA-directed RNA polymerase subunit N (RpoN/RPB10)